MADGYGIYHEFDYGDRHLERGEFVIIETGMMKNDTSLINVGYIKPHDGENLIPCLRCVKKFVASSFIRYQEEKCPMIAIEIPSEPVAAGVGAGTEKTLEQIRQQTLAQSKS